MAVTAQQSIHPYTFQFICFLHFSAISATPAQRIPSNPTGSEKSRRFLNHAPF